MDAAVYLTNQGWRGSGHALQPNGKGISKPLLVSKKTNLLGVGKKAHDAHADQWWLRAFDETLKSLNDKITSKEITSTPSEANVKPLSIAATRWTTNGDLYGGFVRGEGLRGTMGTEKAKIESICEAERPVKRSRQDNPRSRRRRDKTSSRHNSSKRYSNQPSPDNRSQNLSASPATIGTSTKVVPLDQDRVADLASTAFSKAATKVGHSAATSIPNDADEIDGAGPGEHQQCRSKKEGKLKERSKIKSTNTDSYKTEKILDQRNAKTKRKKWNFEGL
ncbi:MAG: hypothetical protein Q9209_007755 [Squamulea sp. 1 TL-2023]